MIRDLLRRSAPVLVFVIAAATLPAGAQTNTAVSTVTLTPEQQAYVERTLASYRDEVDARVAHGDITADEAQRLLAWRQWQLAQQLAGTAPPSQVLEAQAQTDAQRPPAPPYPYPSYAPWGYYAPYAPGPVFYGGLCAGGFGHHWGARICI